MSKETDKQDKADKAADKAAAAAGQDETKAAVAKVMAEAKAEVAKIEAAAELKEDEYPRWAHSPDGKEASRVVNSPDEWPDGWSDTPFPEPLGEQKTGTMTAEHVTFTEDKKK